MANKKNEELVVMPKAGQLENIPDFIEVGNQDGLEHLTADDVQMPRLALAQQMSPELVDDDPKFIEDLRLGNMFNSLTGENYGDGPLEFVVLVSNPPRWVEFNPREAGGGVKDPNVPFGDPRTEFGPNGEVPIATKFYDFVIMLIPSRELVALSCKSTALKVAKQLNGLLKFGNMPMYARIFSVASAMTKNAKGRFAIYKLGSPRVIQDKELYEYAKGMSNAFRGKTINIHREGAENDGDDPTSFDPEAMGDNGVNPM